MNELSEDPAERARKYISNFEEDLAETSIIQAEAIANPEHIQKVTELIRCYLSDSRYHLACGRASTSLASIAYAEGLLDALKMLGLARKSS